MAAGLQTTPITPIRLPSNANSAFSSADFLGNDNPFNFNDRFNQGNQGFNLNNSFAPASTIFDNRPDGAGLDNIGLIPNTDVLGNVLGQPGLFQSDALKQDIAGSNDFFSKDGGSRFIIPGLEALTGIGNLIGSRDLLKLGKEQFGFSRAQSNRDFNAQGQVFNTNLRNQKRKGLIADGTFDTSTPEGQKQFDDALNAYVENNKIDTITL